MIVPDQPARGSWVTVYRVPALIAAISLAGLLSALLLDDLGRMFSWIAVGLPVLIVFAALVRSVLGRNKISAS
jgi:hypothetical protein